MNSNIEYFSNMIPRGVDGFLPLSLLENIRPDADYSWADPKQAQTDLWSLDPDETETPVDDEEDLEEEASEEEDLEEEETEAVD